MTERFAHTARRTRARVVLLLPVLVGVARGGNAESPVRIAGGVDASGHHYTWEVTNLYSSPLVYLQFPQYKADVFDAPQGWRATRVTRNRFLWIQRHGTYTVECEDPRFGIPPHATREFQMRIRREGAPRGTGTVVARFADGTQVSIDGVEVPRTPSFGETYVSLIALAAILLFVVLWRRRRGEVQPSMQDADASA